MINWSGGIVAKYYASIVDPVSWRDISDVDIISGSIKYSETGERASADISCRSFDHDKEYWIRLYLIGKQGGEIERIPLFTGIVSIPDVTYRGRVEDNKLQCYSSLSLADKIYLPLGWYAGMGSNGANTIKDLLSSAIPSNIVVEDVGSDDIPYISQNFVAESGETVLSMVDKILDAINWRIVISGDGTINIKPKSDMPVSMFDYQNNDIFEMDITITDDWYNVPNVYRAVGSGVSSVAKDEDPESRFSIVNRGREIWVNDTECILANDEQIGDYAIRKLKAAQNICKTLDYTRRFDPNVNVSDVVSIKYLEQGISGFYRVKSQTLNIGYGGKVSEQVEGI